MPNRSEHGSGNTTIIGAVITVIVLLGVIEWIFDVNAVGYLVAPVDWVVRALDWAASLGD